jgi:hypothetical protein
MVIIIKNISNIISNCVNNLTPFKSDVLFLSFIGYHYHTWFIYCLTTQTVSQTIQCWMVEWLVNDKLEMTWKKQLCVCVCVCVCVCTHIWSRQGNKAVMIANVPTEIHTNYLPDNSLRHYCYTYPTNNLSLSKSYTQILHSWCDVVHSKNTQLHKSCTYIFRTIN